MESPTHLPCAASCIPRAILRDIWGPIFEIALPRPPSAWPLPPQPGHFPPSLVSTLPSNGASTFGLGDPTPSKLGLSHMDVLYDAVSICGTSVYGARVSQDFCHDILGVQAMVDYGLTMVSLWLNYGLTVV